MVDILRDVMERSYSSWHDDDIVMDGDYGPFT